MNNRSKVFVFNLAAGLSLLLLAGFAAVSHAQTQMSSDEFVDARVESMLALFDANDDGMIDKSEIEAKFKADFTKLDTDGDGIFNPALDRK